MQFYSNQLRHVTQQTVCSDFSSLSRSGKTSQQLEKATRGQSENEF